MPIPKPWMVVAIAQLADGTIAKSAKRIMAKNAASAVYRRAQEIHRQYRGDLQPRVVGVSANPTNAADEGEVIGMGPNAWHDPPASQSNR